MGGYLGKVNHTLPNSSKHVLQFVDDRDKLFHNVCKAEIMSPLRLCRALLVVQQARAAA